MLNHIAEEEGDETSTGKHVLLNKNNSEIYIPEIDEGELSSIFVVDAKRNNNEIISNLDLYQEFRLKAYAESLTYDNKENIFFACAIFDVSNVKIIKNYSSSYCLEVISTNTEKGYVIIDGRLGIIDLGNGITNTIIKGWNISSVYLNEAPNSLYVLGYSTDDRSYGDDNEDENITSYIYKIWRYRK